MEIEAESLNRSNELEEMHGKLEARKMVMGDMSIDCKLATGVAKRQEEQLNAEVRSLLVAGTALSVTQKQLMVILVCI